MLKDKVNVTVLQALWFVGTGFGAGVTLRWHWWVAALILSIGLNVGLVISKKKESD